MVSLSIPVAPQSANVLLRSHWSKQRKEVQRWGKLIAAYNPGKWQEALPVKATVQFTIYRKRLLDEDNATAALKPCIDAMCKLRFLSGDSPRWLNLKKPRQIRSIVPRTEIRITYMGET